jgi:beta-glucanase (GH16 family)
MAANGAMVHVMTRSLSHRWLIGGLVLTASTAVMAAVVLPQATPAPVDTSRLRQTFAEEFTDARLNPDRWTQGAATDRLDERTIVWNAERQAYFSPDWLGLGIQPVTIADGALTISARPLTAPEKAVLRSNIAGVPEWARKPALERIDYASGRVITRGKFAQRYGYFEVRAKFSGGRGLWPALWLLPADGGWPPEIDIMEALGHNPNGVIQTIHSASAPKQDVVTEIKPTDGGWHTYGMMWGPKTIDAYVDGVKVKSFTTPPDAHKPMYFIANLAVGGNWPGDPDANTPFPATLSLDYVRIYAWPGDGAK